MTDDHLPKPGQRCEDCSELGHTMCWDNVASPVEEFQLFTEVHDVMKGAA